MVADPHPSARRATWMLDDAQVGEDHLGSHEPMAAGVYELIPRELAGRTMRSEAHWCSGKSPVVRLSVERLRALDEHAAAFDAWHGCRCAGARGFL